MEEESKEKNDKKKKKKISSLDFTKEHYIQLIGEDLSKYNNENIKEPLIKSEGGSWINFSDFNFLFNTFLVLYNPRNIFKGGDIAVDDNWLDYKLDCFELKDDFTVIKLNKENIDAKIRNIFSQDEPDYINLEYLDDDDDFILSFSAFLFVE